MNNKIIKVIVVDDSALIRALLNELLSAEPRIQVVATAKDAYEARELIKQHNPDVITLDIEMPKMNGIAFLEKVMRLRPMPVLMISTLTQEGAPTTLQALELGAVDYVAKPQTGNAADLSDYRDEIIEKILAAAKAKVRGIRDSRSKEELSECSSAINSVVKSRRLKRGFICAIGASTGGTEAIKEIITVLPKNSPAIVISQHIPEAFSASFAKRVDSHSIVNVYEAEDQQPILEGSVYIAPGHSHLKIAKDSRGGYVCSLDKGELVNRHRPAVEVLFDSVTHHAPSNSMGVLLTGMGADGAEALLRMKQQGLFTVIQDEKSSVVWGMPGAASRLDAAEKTLDLKEIAQCIIAKAYS